MNAIFIKISKIGKLVIIKIVDHFSLDWGRKYFLHFFPHRFIFFSLDQIGQLIAESLSSMTQMNFQNLSDIHTGRHAQRIQHHVHRCPIFEIG